MTLLKRIINRLMPEDKEVGCGYGPFKLAPDHPFTRACELHDQDFDDAHNGMNERTLDEADWLLFWRMILLAKAQPTPELQCHYAMEICLTWPLARFVGGLTWDGDRKQLVSNAPKSVKKDVEESLNWMRRKISSELVSGSGTQS